MTSYKVNPSEKSKRYRDKLREEIKALEDLLPIDRKSLHRKLDSQTVYRLSIAFFRTKLFLQAARDADRTGNEQSSVSAFPVAASGYVPGVTSASSAHLPDSASVMQALDGFLLVMTSDGTMLYASHNILTHLGFNQVDLMMRCIYGIVHPDDHEELKTVLEQTLSPDNPLKPSQQRFCCQQSIDGSSSSCRKVSFLCRIKCFNGTTTGYLKMHCVGHTRFFPNVVKSTRTSNEVLFLFCRPFQITSTDASIESRSNGFWTKHGLDLHFKQMDELADKVLGYTSSEMEGKSLYELIHPEDLLVVRNCHHKLIREEKIQTMYFRIQAKDGHFIWLHTSGRVFTKSAKKYSIMFNHCPVREEDSSFIQQEVVIRQRDAVRELMFGDSQFPHQASAPSSCSNPSSSPYYPEHTTPPPHIVNDRVCPSSMHTSADRHSPVFPNSQHLSPTYPKRKSPLMTSPPQNAIPPPEQYYAAQDNVLLHGHHHHNHQHAGYWDSNNCSCSTAENSTHRGDGYLGYDYVQGMGGQGSTMNQCDVQFNGLHHSYPHAVPQATVVMNFQGSVAIEAPTNTVFSNNIHHTTHQPTDSACFSTPHHIDPNHHPTKKRVLSNTAAHPIASPDSDCQYAVQRLSTYINNDLNWWSSGHNKQSHTVPKDYQNSQYPDHYTATPSFGIAQTPNFLDSNPAVSHSTAEICPQNWNAQFKTESFNTPCRNNNTGALQSQPSTTCTEKNECNNNQDFLAALSQL